MKRNVILILLLFVAGAIVNVAVAWGISLRGDFTNFAIQARSSSGAKTIPLDTSVFRRADSEFIRQYDRCGFERRGLGIRNLRVSYWTYNLAADDAGNALVERECGWPILTLGGRCRDLNKMEWAIPLPKSWNENGTWSRGRVAPTILPLRPLWPGFAINTVFYAAIVWLLFIAPFALRRRRRIKRGLCPKCAYPVGGSDVCTECGGALPSPSR